MIKLKKNHVGSVDNCLPFSRLLETVYFESLYPDFSLIPRWSLGFCYIFFNLFIKPVHFLLYYILFKKSKPFEGGALFGMLICFDFVVCTGSGVDITLYTTCYDIDVQRFVDWVIGGAQSSATPPELKDIIQNVPPLNTADVTISTDTKPFFYVRAYGDFSNTPLAGLNVYFIVCLTSTGSLALKIVVI